ncbi:reverse transcriptase domain-containing protein [Tanacetum coccineum]
MPGEYARHGARIELRRVSLSTIEISYNHGSDASNQSATSALRDSSGVHAVVRNWSHVLVHIAQQSKDSTGDTPFSLVYGTEAVIPAEIGMPTIRTAEVNIATNDDERHRRLSCIELNDASHAEDTGKLGPKWEGPYEVTEALGKGAYKLRDMDGRELPRTWNICNLKKCYL